MKRFLKNQYFTKLISILKLGLFFLTIHLNAFASGNGWVSSGGDHFPESHGHAWFADTSPISFCIKSNTHFSISESDLSQLIFDSIFQWKNYYEENIVFRIKDNEFSKINFNFEYKKDCSKNIDITFYFGVENDLIKKVKNGYVDPFGLNILESYHFQNKRSKGLLWFSDPKVSYPNAHSLGLSTIILHELGHVFGMTHINGTVMKEDISKLVLLSNEKSDLGLNKIDLSRQLLFKENKSWEVPGYFTIKKNNLFESQLLKKLIGLENIQTGSVSLINSPIANQNQLNLKLKIKIQEQIFELPIIIQKKLAELPIKGTIFKTAYQDNDEKIKINEIFSSGNEYFGTIHSAIDDKSYSLILDLNFDSTTPNRVIIIDENQSFNIFEQASPSSFWKGEIKIPIKFPLPKNRPIPLSKIN